ncbi:hypothetical protein [Endothiovibrio diazotrophicus]
MNRQRFEEHLAAWRGYYIQQLAWERRCDEEQAAAAIAHLSTEELLAEKAPGLLQRMEEQAEEAR